MNARSTQQTRPKRKIDHKTVFAASYVSCITSVTFASLRNLRLMETLLNVVEWSFVAGLR